MKRKSSQGVAGWKQRVAVLEEKVLNLDHELELYRALGDFEKSGFSVERVLTKFLARAMQYFRTTAGTVFIVDPETSELVFQVVRGRARARLKGRRLPHGEGIAGWVARYGKARLVRDVRDDPNWKADIAREVGYPTKDILAVPLRARSGQLMGVIELLNSRSHAGFRRRDLRHMKALSGSLGNLLENARLWEEARRRTHQLELLNEVSHVLNSTLDPEEVRRRTIDAAMRLLGSEAASLLLIEKDSGHLYFEVALGAKAVEVEQVRLRPDEGIAGWVVRHGKPVMIEDCRKDPRWSRRVDRRARFITRDMVCVPVKVRGKTIGAIQAINKRKGVFGKEDLELLVVLADQVAVALENARLFEEAKQTFLETSEALAEAIELRDAYTGGHTRRVTAYSLATGRTLRLGEEELTQLRMAAILHDIGKLGVDDGVLRKPGRLDDEEFMQMKKHPRLGAEILQAIHTLARAIPGIRSHHERTDGRGYPDGLAGADIPLFARIISVADTYDAMTSDRPYRKGLSKSVAIREIIDCTGTQFDPEVVQAFLLAFRRGGITGRRERVPNKSGQNTRSRGTRASRARPKRKRRARAR